MDSDYACSGFVVLVLVITGWPMFGERYLGEAPIHKARWKPDLASLAAQSAASRGTLTVDRRFAWLSDQPPYAILLGTGRA